MNPVPRRTPGSPAMQVTSHLPVSRVCSWLVAIATCCVGDSFAPPKGAAPPLAPGAEPAARLANGVTPSAGEVPTAAPTGQPIPPWVAKAPPLPPPQGEILRVATADELLAAVDRVGPGGTILLADGHYKLPRVIVLQGKQNLAIRSVSADPAKVTLSGRGWDSQAPGDDLIHVGHCDGVTIADLTFADCRSYGIKVEAENAPKDIHIYHCRFRDIGVRAVKGSAGQDPNIRAVKGSVRCCVFENTKVPPADWLFGGDYIAAIDMMALEDWTFSDNVFRNIRGRNGGGRAAIFIWVRSRQVVVERNLIVGCDRGVAFGNPGQSTANLAGERLVYVADGVIRNNFIAGGPDCGIELWHADRIKVFNNTIWRPEQNWSRGIRVGTGTARTEIVNNLVHGEIRLDGGEAQMSHNLAGRLEGYFVDPAAGNLALTPAATGAIDQGVPLPEVTDDIRRRPRTGRPDLGAWESGGDSGIGGRGAVALETQPPVVLRGERIMVEAQAREGRLRERYLALRDGAWIEVATVDQGRTVGPVSFITAEGTPLVGAVRSLSLSDGTLVEELTAGDHRVVRKLTLVGNGPWIRVATRLEPAGRVSLRQLSDHFKFAQRPDWSFAPSVGGFNPDAQYKAPLILVQADRNAFAIVPDVAGLRREELKRCSHALDLDVPAGPVLGVGFMPARLASHAVYAHDTNRTWTADTAIENAYYLFVTATAAPAQAYREAVRFHWERFGRSEQAHAADQQVGTDARYRSLTLWDAWRAMVWQQESPQAWLSVPLPDGSTGGGVRTKRWGPGPSVYLSSWFNTLRTSCGMALYLLLYQQCWSNPVLENLTSTAMLLGGFTTQNSDAEWSDARQSQCGNVLLDYYRTTGKIEYLERGIAALRAQFPISPSENWAHVGYGAKAGVSSFHWGTGSGMAGIEIEEDYLHDAIVDVKAGRGVGVNGLNLSECSISEGQIRLRLSTPFTWNRAPVVGFRHVEPSRRYQVYLNGTEAGAWQGADLEKGVTLSLGTQIRTNQASELRRPEIELLERMELPGGLVREKLRLPGFDPDESVPAIAIHPVSGGPFPVAVCLHSFRGAKENLEGWCRDLAVRGLGNGTAHGRPR